MTELELLEAVPLAHAAVARAAADHDVRVLFFKGPVAALQGLRPVRVSQDVDALVDPARLPVLAAALTELGWVDEHAFKTPTAATYSRTHRHASWPCELDLHSVFPGVYAPEQEAFERLWDRRESVEVAAHEVPCPDPQAHALLLALNSLRDPHETTKVAQLADLVRRVSGSFDDQALRGLGRLAGQLGAADTAAPFLSQVGAPNEALGSTTPDDLHAWHLRTRPAWRLATWMDGLRQRPLRSRPGYLWYALALSDEELRMADPNLPPGRRALLGARWRRAKRGARAVRTSLHAARTSATTRPAPAVARPAATTQTTWKSVLLPPWVARQAAGVLGSLDRITPFKRGVLIRTFPDFDDQGLEMARALADAGVERLVWLVKSPAPPRQSVLDRLPNGALVVNAGSLKGIGEYLRARVVIHTHGLYAAPARSRRKLFVNLWHGMPIKRLESESLVARRQTDVLTVTSQLHAEHLAETWALDPAHIVRTGLPRNDVLARSATARRPEALQQLIPEGRPLVLWLPTYRRSVIGQLRTDGVDFDNDFQLPSCTRDDIEALAEELGVHVVLKTHPMAGLHAPGSHGPLGVWDDAALAATGLSLYELLAHADVLVTDYSSVWVDFLLVDRPIIFAMADVDEYAASRGRYASTDEGDLLPGPVVRDLAGLRAALAESLGGDDAWAARRRAVRPLHHEWLDAGSADRVAALIMGHLGERQC